MRSRTALRELERADSVSKVKKNVVQAIEAVARLLGNTRSVCRKSYIHPAIIDAYMDGSLLDARERPRKRGRDIQSRLRCEEAAVLAILRRQLSSARTAAKVA